MLKLGLDIGSTTLKLVLLDESGTLLFCDYRRHFSRITQTADAMFEALLRQFPDIEAEIALSGSAGMGVAELLGLPFVQEVYAERIAVKHRRPQTDAVIELGGEDAKIIFLTGGFEMRMNGTCAGGTGAFIDQMASLMQITPGEMNDLAKRHEQVYAIASRCGVFAKSDIQPLLNQGARKEDLAAGIFAAVANQTVGGLAQGRKIAGNVLYLGGPLTFLSELRTSFDEVLGVHGENPENALYYVAIGAAEAGVGTCLNLNELRKSVQTASPKRQYNRCKPLFQSEAEYLSFLERHKKPSEGIKERRTPAERMYLGIDAGSTTVKLLLCDEAGQIFKPLYTENHGNPVEVVRGYLTELYRQYPELQICSAAVTGYGEDIIKNAFGVDYGIVETVAHYTAAKRFRPDVDFILDIGGQDIKCFRVRNGVVDNLYLNEACSSGCGSFLQTFAQALGYTAEEFSKLALYADMPVDLGSRCTVFMNSSVKQAQKEGAGMEDIAAGLSISVVKNALYKVIRCANAEALGKNIVVQGGTFQSDAVLRAFEQEIGTEVIRPQFAPLMGAYGAALYAMSRKPTGKSTVLNAAALKDFVHEVTRTRCGGCGNRCSLTVNRFGAGRRFIAGNRCEKPLHPKGDTVRYNLYEWKLNYLGQYRKNERREGKTAIGIPMGLSFYEQLPFWHEFLSALDFDVLVSPLSDRALFHLGQQTIPSDTACYPAKLMHGHMEALLQMKPDAIFYPGSSYNVEEGLGVNHYNCPVVAYYPQLLKLNVDGLKQTKFICDFVSIAEKKKFQSRIQEILSHYFPAFSKREIARAAERGYAAQERYFDALRKTSEEYRLIAAEQKKPVMVLAGRPYHLDPEVNHGISEILCRLGAVVITEDSISHTVTPFAVKVRNQWSYHARLYAAAKYVSEHREEPIHLIQLVSFGCGVDAVTTDEVRSIVEASGKPYTQIKIDEVSNMSTVNIRLRSLFAMLPENR